MAHAGDVGTREVTWHCLPAYDIHSRTEIEDIMPHFAKFNGGLDKFLDRAHRMRASRYCWLNNDKDANYRRA